MAKTKNFKLMEEIRQHHSFGLTDGKIATLTGKRVNEIHYYRYHVLKLPAIQTKRVYGNENDKLRGYIIRGIKSSAKRRGLEFDLEFSDLRIVDKCPLLDLELNYKNFFGNSDSNADNFATVDRIDNTKGYVKGNVWIISRLANNMKNKASKEQLKMFYSRLQEYDIV